MIFEVTDRINLRIAKHNEFNVAVENHKEYICAQTLADVLELVEDIDPAKVSEVEIDKDVRAEIEIEKVI